MYPIVPVPFILKVNSLPSFFPYICWYSDISIMFHMCVCVSVSCLHATPSHYFILIYFDVTSGQVPSLISFKSCLYHFLYIFLSRWILAAAFLVPWKIFLGLRLELHWIDWYLFHTHEQVSISPLIPAFVRSLLFFKKCIYTVDSWIHFFY